MFLRKNIDKITAYGKQAHYQTIPEGKKYTLYAKADTIEYYPVKRLAKLIGNAHVTAKGDKFDGHVITYDENNQSVYIASAPTNNIHMIFQP